MRIDMSSFKARIFAVFVLALAGACVSNGTNELPAQQVGGAKAVTPETQPAAKPVPAGSESTAQVKPTKSQAKHAAVRGTQHQAARTARVALKAKKAALHASALKGTRVAKSPVHTSRVTRYVTARVLNVRSRPAFGAPVVGKLTRGSMFGVTVTGKWAKLGDQQYVLARYLGRHAPETERSLAARK